MSGRPPSPRYIVVARHGERLDYVQRDAGTPWTPTAAKPYDPPLTDHGREQAYQLGRHLQKELQRLQIPPITTIYTSPFLRCRQTSVAAAKGLQEEATSSLSESSQTTAAATTRICVEYGLSESFNEPWYRSWALPGTDGTWGYKLPNEAETGIDPSTLHPWSKQPIQELPLFTDWQTDGETPEVDTTYTSKTQITKPYTFHPSNLETKQEQCARMHQVVVDVASTTATTDNNDSGAETIMLTSHGAPVTHLFEALTGQSWQVHGRSVYCCYSVYRQATPPHGPWEAIVVNESRYLNENLKGDNYVSQESK